MEKVISKGEIDRLGNTIREQSIAIDDNTLEALQAYRTSHKDAVAHTFNLLCKYSRKIHSSTIVTFRIKRFDSIIRKLERYPEMRFSRMWDIAGCRCILKDDKEVYKMRNIIRNAKELEIIKEYDYIKSPQDDGYKSLHVFVKHSCSESVIEVQLRSQLHHNWATLVEISDLLFDSKLKEYSEDKKLLRFHFLLSKGTDLGIEEKYEIAKIIKEYNYFEKLSEVFSRNYIKVRKQWFELESRYNHKYFMIEATKDDIPKIKAFSSFSTAESNYFEIYKSRQNSNIVLTHLQKPSYNQVSIAYSNYILTFHSFLSDSLGILESLIVESLEKKKFYSFFKNLSLYNRLVLNHIQNFVTEIKEVQEVTETHEKQGKNIQWKGKEWIEDIKNQIYESNKRAKRLQVAIRKNAPNRKIEKYIIKQIMKLINRRFKKEIEKL